MVHLSWYLTPEALVITDAAKYTARQVRKLLNTIRDLNPDNEELAKRTNRSYINEWATHALAYRMHIMRERSKDADLQFDMKPCVKLMYNFLGSFARLILMFCRPVR